LPDELHVVVAAMLLLMMMMMTCMHGYRRSICEQSCMTLARPWTSRRTNTATR